MSNLTDVRLNIMDPYGALYFETVTELPETLIPQTAYIIDNQYYVDGKQTNLKISDAKLNSLLAVSGATVDSVTLQALKICRATLKHELIVSKTSSGAESDEYQNLSTLYSIYNSEIETLEKTVKKGSSRYQQFSTPDWALEV